MVTVRGPTNDVEKAVKLLKEMSEEKQLSGVTVEIKAKPQHHKFLIGKAGIHIQKIRDDTGARIIFPGNNDTDKETIVIIGTQVACDKAKKIMEAKIVELNNIVEDSMTVAPKFHKHFVARRGKVLRGIGEEFGGVVITLPDNSHTNLILTGKRSHYEALAQEHTTHKKTLKEVRLLSTASGTARCSAGPRTTSMWRRMRPAPRSTPTVSPTALGPSRGSAPSSTPARSSAPPGGSPRGSVPSGGSSVNSGECLGSSAPLRGFPAASAPSGDSPAASTPLGLHRATEDGRGPRLQSGMVQELSLSWCSAKCFAGSCECFLEKLALSEASRALESSGLRAKSRNHSNLPGSWPPGIIRLS